MKNFEVMLNYSNPDISVLVYAQGKEVGEAVGFAKQWVRENRPDLAEAHFEIYAAIAVPFLGVNKVS